MTLPPQIKERFVVLDGLRGMAALVVWFFTWYSRIH